MSRDEFHDLGMDRKIPRRDFLNGVAIAVGGTWAGGLGASQREGRGESRLAQATTGDDYPPALTGVRGNHAGSVDLFPRIREGAYAQAPINVDAGEEYDLVIVGGGISGLSAAYFWRRALGASQRILILDNHDDFGGHAKRNEFQYQGRRFISYGGTMGISTPYPYSYTAKSLVLDLGIQVERNSEFLIRDIPEKYGLSRGFFFAKELFGEDRLLVGYGRQPWDEFFAKAPLTEAARKDLIRLHGKNPDYMAGTSPKEKATALARMSYQDYLLKVAKMTPEALSFFLANGGRNNKRVDTTPALEAALRGSVGFDGLGLETDRSSFREAAYNFHFPDGNASMARLLVRKLIPDAVPGQPAMEGILQAPVVYAKLDQAGAGIHIRLNSTVVRVAHEGPVEKAVSVRVAYVRDGKAHGVRARNCILACYNGIIPGIVPDLPAKQKEALAYPVKVPMLYTNVLIRRWISFQRLGVSGITAPGMYHTGTSLDLGTTIGGYRGVTTPEEPVVVHMTRNPNKPGLPRREQNRAGQSELLSMTFEQFELEIRRQLGRMLSTGGFDPAADILGITVNRWPHGYSYTYDTLGDPDVPPELRPHVVGRQRFGLVTIANSDAGAAAFTNQAIDEAHRAVQELLVKNGLT
jgi:spermidine dehydrogenase